jgi:hypothetical protein
MGIAKPILEDARSARIGPETMKNEKVKKRRG